VTEELRQRILRGEMLPGSRIRETELAEQFGVSRGPVREALRSLEVAGLVLRLPRQASYVAPVSKRDVDEIYTLRAVIEELAIRRTLRSAGDVLAHRLDAAATALAAAVAAGDAGTVVDADIEFHSVFYALADHQRLAALWGTLTDPLRIMMRLSERHTDPEWRGTVGGHLKLVRAAGAGDAQACVDAAVEHLEQARHLVMGFVEAQELQLPAARP
jgi:GntR family transcriptional regulator of gluconate operon